VRRKCFWDRLEVRGRFATRADDDLTLSAQDAKIIPPGLTTVFSQSSIH
jgi:hypothetical protein